MSTANLVKWLLLAAAALAVILAVRSTVFLLRERQIAAAWELQADSLVRVADSLRIEHDATLIGLAAMTREADSLRGASRRGLTRVVHVRDSLPPLPPQPVVCDACVQRVGRLEALLETAGAAAQDAIAASVRDSTAAAERLVLYLGARRVLDSLANAVRERPTPPGKPALAARGALEGTLDGPAATVVLQRGSWYAGSRWRFAGETTQEWVVGFERTVRLW